MSCSILVEPADLKLHCYSEGYVLAELDKLTDKKFTSLLLLAYDPTPKKKDPKAKEAQGATASTSSKAAEEENPVKLAMHTPSEPVIQGKEPPKYSATEVYSGAAKPFSLPNMRVLNRLCAYIHLNGGYQLASTPKDGSCMFSAIRWSTDMPLEYVTQLFRREIVVFLAQNADFFLGFLELTIKGHYGAKRLSKEEFLRREKEGILTVDERVDYHAPGPFSYVGYLKYLLQESTWGDEAILVVISMMWQATVTILYAESLVQTRIRHDREIQFTDIVLLYCGGAHYVGAG